MANILVNENSLQAIANAIREKTGESNTTYTPAEMAYGIKTIKGYTARDEGKVINNGQLVNQTSIDVTKNGYVDTTTNNLVNVNIQPYLLSTYITRNGDYFPLDCDGFDEVIVNVPTDSETFVISLSVTENGTYNAPEGTAYNPITVNVSGESVSVPQRDVNFYDYDGTIVYSYNTSDFLNLLSMPSNPTHAGLTAQGWNWSLVDAKAYINDCGKLNIGQMYITDDGKTRIYIHLNEGRTSPMLGICPNGTVDVDWGDGTAHDMLAGTSTSRVKWTPNHAYAAPGDYVIKLTVTGSAGFYGWVSSYSGILRYSSEGDGRDQPYQNSVQKIEVGSGVTGIGDYAFYYCFSLTSVTIPNSVISIGSKAFLDCSGIGLIHFIPTTPPTVSDANAFSGIPTDCKIYVPTGSLAAYQSAANYPDPSIYEYIEE